ncbi:transferase [Streptomyces paludis]|uniref:Transferase n=1 Tax=Streptomyces paludis TaxID=2282738 RepID=A0A345I2E3_9ACTN|nr:transferase [Streptomyces paludis]
MDTDGRLTVRLAPLTADRPRLLLRQHPRKGRPEDPPRTADLEPTADGGRRAVLDPTPPLAEGRWDLCLLDGPGAPPVRLLPGLLDLRALLAGRDPDRTPEPLAVRIPYPTKDGFLALRTWLRPAHAEIDTLRLSGHTMTVRARLFGARITEGAEIRLIRRGQNRAVRTYTPSPEGTRGFSFTADYRDLLADRAADRDLWDVFLRPGPAGPRVRVGRLLDDVAQRKAIFVYPATPLDGATVRPYYTVDNDLALDVDGRALPG